MSPPPVHYAFAGTGYSRAQIRADSEGLNAVALVDLPDAGFRIPTCQLLVCPEVPAAMLGRTEDGNEDRLRLTLYAGGVSRTRLRLTLAHEMAHVREIAVLGAFRRHQGWASWADRLRSEFLAERASEELLCRAFGATSGLSGAARAAEHLLGIAPSVEEIAGRAATIRAQPDTESAAMALRTFNETVCEALLTFAYAAGALAGEGLAVDSVFTFPGLAATPPLVAAARLLLKPLSREFRGLPLLPAPGDYQQSNEEHAQSVARLTRAAVNLGSFFLDGSVPGSPT